MRGMAPPTGAFEFLSASNNQGENMQLCTRAAKAAAAGLLLAVVSLAAIAGPVWFADNKNLSRLDSITSIAQQVAITVKVDDVRSLAVNADGSVWALRKDHLTRYGLNGGVATDIELKILGLKNADQIALDGRDGSLWLGEGKDADESEDDTTDGHAKRIVRLDATGQRVQDFNSPGRIRAMVLGLDQSLWLLGNKTLWHYSRAGERLSVIDFKPITHDKAKLLALDPLGVWLWLGAERQLVRVDGDLPASAPIKLDLTKDLALLTIDPRTGELWAATEQSLILYSDTATLKRSIDLKALDLKDPSPWHSTR